MTAVDSPAPKLCAVIVTCNRLKQLQQTLTKLLASGPETLAQLIVVNNASTDGTTGYLDGLDEPRVLIHHISTNIGGAGGFETGMRLASEHFDPDWMVLMDDDARPHDGVLERFFEQDRSNAEAWAAAVYQPDGRICDINRPSYNPFLRPGVLFKTLIGAGRDGFHLGPEEYSSSEQRIIDGTSFVGFFISRQGVARVGYPNGNLFLYGDDIIYTLQLTKAGGTIRFAPELGFEHAFSSVGEEDKRFRPLWKCYYHYRNLLFVYRMASGPFFVLILPAFTAKWLLKARHYGGERMQFLRYVLKAIYDGLRGRTGISHEEVLALGVPARKKE